MKPKKQKTISKRMRNLLTQQVENYTHSYHPEMGEVEIQIRPCGRFANVKTNNNEEGSA
jgi:hypothetical protein